MIGRRALGCALIAAIVVAASASAVSAAGGLGWSGPVPISPYAQETVGCASASFCVAGGYTGRVEVWDGSSWSAPDDVDGTNNINAVSCASAKFCAIVDNAGTAVIWNGHSWSAPDDIDGPNTMFGVSCVSPSFCFAVGASGDAFRWNGSTWSAADDIDGANALTSVSCVSTSFCTTVDDAYALTWNGSAWSAPVKIDPGGNLGWVSCASAKFCVAVEDFGNGTTMWNGSTWSSIVDIDPPSGTFTNRLSGVSCVSASSCVAVAVAGLAITWNGSAWSTPLDIVPSGSDLDSFDDPVSCVSNSFCAVIGAYPYSFALTYGRNQPVLARNEVAALVTGSVSVEVPGATTFSPLSGSTPIPVGSVVNATNGTVRLVSATPGHGSSSGEFYGGEFKLEESRSGLTDLALTGGTACAVSSTATKSHKHRAVRSLWGDAHGSFETTDGDAAALVLGTKWEMAETCTGTTIHAIQGVIRITDYARHRTVLVYAPHSYHAGS